MTLRFWSILAAVGSLLAVATVGGALSAEGADPAPEELFATSDNCLACHNGMATPGGDDASIGTRWRSTIMAHASRDPYWQAGVRREVSEHPAAAAAIEDKCSTCHMPMARFVRARRGGRGEVLSFLAAGPVDTAAEHGALAEDGVACAVCHQIAPDNLGRDESFGGGFAIDTRRAPGERRAFGPFAVGAGTAHVMRSATGFVPTSADHLRSAEHCATCHTLYTHALDENGREVAELAEQVPYLEWKHSDYAGQQSCQDCHMRPVAAATPIASVLGKPRDGALQHLFRGGNFLLLRLLGGNRHRLGVTAAPGEIDENARATAEHLAAAAAAVAIDSAAATLADGRLAVPIEVENRAGHKLPTAYPSRRAWLRVTVTDGGGKVLFSSGDLRADGSIDGNDNDEDPARFEAHYDEISEPGQVQIYEAIMGDPDGRVTTGLLRAATYLKDNRVLPVGFDKTTAGKDVAVAGGARADASFEGGRDRIVYSVRLGEAAGPFTVTAELWYQPIAYRWAMNLATVSGDEPRRFLGMYRRVPGRETAVRIAAASATIAPAETQLPAALPPPAGE